MSKITLSLIESIVPKEVVYSGDYKFAEQLLEREVVMSEFLPDIFYLLGNRFYSAKQTSAAELAWEKSSELSLVKEKEAKISEYYVINHKKLYMQTIGLILIIVFCLYVIIFSFFKRESGNSQFLGNKFFSEEISFWDEWWDTGRSIPSPMVRRFNENELWPLLKRTLENIFGSNDQKLSDEVREKLKRWLEFSQRPQFGERPTNYYSLIARGLFEAREFEEAISTLNDSKFFAETSLEFEKIYQDLGTIYYYRGYKLQSNGLAKYDINDVRLSVKSYEIALTYGEDPYLYGNLGWGYYLLGDNNLSIANSLKALILKPELNYARMNLGIAYLKIRNYKLAFSTYESLEGNSPSPDEYEGGLRDLMELQISSPEEYPFTNFVIGQLYLQQGLYKKAYNAFKKFISNPFPNKIWQERTRLILKNMGRAKF